MEPERCTNAGLVDLLDRILDKGVVLNADVIISVAGVPLIGLNLRAALAGMDTMLRYGIWEDWDAAQRAWETERRKLRDPTRNLLSGGEEIRLRAFGTCWHSTGIYQAWRPGEICVTNRRIFAFRKEPFEILFAACYEDIEGFAVEREEIMANGETECLHIHLKDGTMTKLHSEDVHSLKDAAESEMCALGLLREGYGGRSQIPNMSDAVCERERVLLRL
ncbi:MAG: gas vesicle protein [Methanothrix sp.]|uniref:gas vesicle protein n=1 Tax=Methanothrix sp. TaxID=90426 RepID=UPI0025EED24C|nr:gas vesicle protein [Methanothrix sp.]MCQ8902534.1 gas vesicle protein [Methanothrix sp.]